MSAIRYQRHCGRCRLFGQKRASFDPRRRSRSGLCEDERAALELHLRAILPRATTHGNGAKICLGRSVTETLAAAPRCVGKIYHRKLNCSIRDDEPEVADSVLKGMEARLGFNRNRWQPSIHLRDQQTSREYRRLGSALPHRHRMDARCRVARSDGADRKKSALALRPRERSRKSGRRKRPRTDDRKRHRPDAQPALRIEGIRDNQENSERKQ